MSQPPIDPIALFSAWYREAEAAEPVNPSAMTLATATPEGRPSARLVLLKGHDADGFVFYTNLNSAKSGELDANPHAALCFYWKSLARQVRIEGRVEPVSAADADAYSPAGPGAARSAPGPPISPSPWNRGKFSNSAPRSSRPNSPAKIFRARPFGRATGWCPNASSSGPNVATGCTTANCSSGRRTARGGKVSFILKPITE